jgi:hypothetical protein
MYEPEFCAPLSMVEVELRTGATFTLSWEYDDTIFDATEEYTEAEMHVRLAELLTGGVAKVTIVNLDGES